MRNPRPGAGAAITLLAGITLTLAACNTARGPEDGPPAPPGPPSVPSSEGMTGMEAETEDLAEP